MLVEEKAIRLNPKKIIFLLMVLLCNIFLRILCTMLLDGVWVLLICSIMFERCIGMIKKYLVVIVE